MADEKKDPEVRHEVKDDDASKQRGQRAAGQGDLNQRVAELEKQLAASNARVTAMTPQSGVPANGGGPGVNNHLDSWSLAQQEAANAGEWHDEWGDNPNDGDEVPVDPEPVTR